MAIKNFSDVRIQMKRDTSAEWEKNNPVLLDGEKIIVDTTAGEVREKIGDGTKTYTQLPFTDESLRSLIAAKVDKVNGKQLSTNDYTTSEKEKLSGIDDGANKYVHPSYTAKSSGLYKVTVDSLGHVSATSAVTKSDITALGIPGQDTNTTYSEATTTANGLMSSTDKVKLDGIDTGANKYVHPSYTSKTSGLYKVAVDSLGHVSAATAVTKADITGLGIPGQDTTYSEATTTADGLMAKEDKVKLDGIDSGANKYVHPSYTAKSAGLYKVTVDSTGHVSATTAVTKSDITALGIPGQDTNTTYSEATSSASGLMSDDDKAKLDGIDSGANKYVHPGYTSKASGLYKVTVDSTGHVSAATAVSKTDITGLGIPASDTTYSNATSTAAGLMSKDDKAKLDGIDSGANKYVHPSHTSYNSGLYKVTVDGSGHISEATAVTKADITGLGIPASNTTYSNATTTASGLMSYSDKAKLDGIDSGANKYVHPSYTAKSSGLYKVTVDGSGHVSATTAVAKADITALGIPGSNTTYLAGTGLELSGTTFNHSNSIDAGTVKGDDSKTLVYTGSFTIPKITYDSEGHITSVGTTTMTMPAKPAEYTHPSTHSATMITEDSTHRFVTDDQITTWDAKASASSLSSHTGNKSNPHSVTKSQVGLGNVTNDSQVKRSEMGVAGGVATLDANGTVVSSQLPSYVDDVIEGYYYNSKFHEDSSHTTVITGESGKIYIDLSTNKTYRWTGTVYAVISETLALGETSSTAYSGDKGKANAAAIVTINEKLSGIDEGANKYVHPSHTAYSAGLYKVTVNSLGHITAATAVTKSDITGLGIPGSNTTYSSATSTTAGLMSSTDKAKLDGIDSGANKYVHPSYTAKSSGLYKVTVDGSGHVSATAAVAKADITALGIPGSDTTYSSATTTSAGLMSKDDKVKLDGIATGANNYSHPGYASKASGLYKVTVDGYGHVSAATAVTKADITALGIPASNTTYSEATSSTSGLMSDDDKAKLDGIATGANKYVHPSYTAHNSGLYKVTVDGTGHVSGVSAVTKTDITGLGIPGSNTTYSEATTTANGLMSYTDKVKLDGIATGANNYSHPSYTAKSSGLYKVTVDGYGHVSATAAVAKADITALGIPASDTTYSNATTTANGLMSYTDKVKLDGIATGANNYSHPGYTSKASGLYKVTVDSTGHVSATAAVAKADITALGIPASDTNTTYDLGASTSSSNGNVKLNLIAGGSGSGTDSISIKGTGATTVTTNADGVITISSTDNNTTYSNATTSTAGLMSAADKVLVNKISNLESRLATVEEKIKTAVFYA